MRRTPPLPAYPALVLLAACATEAPVEPTTEGVWTHVLEPSCGQSDCHLRPQPQQGVDFYDVDSTLATTVDVVPSVGDAALSYPAIVVPGDPDASFLIAKVTTPGVSQGIVMPPGDEQLTDEAVELLRAWILALDGESR